MPLRPFLLLQLFPLLLPRSEGLEPSLEGGRAEGPPGGGGAAGPPAAGGAAADALSPPKTKHNLSPIGKSMV